MKITLLQENLLTAIQQATRFIASKPPLPILTGLYLQVKKGGLMMRATDLRVGFQTKVGGKVIEEGQGVVAAKPLQELISTLRPGPLTLTTLAEGGMEVEWANGKAKLQTFTVEDFPPFPSEDKDMMTFPRQQLLTLLESVLYAAGLDETRPILASVHLVIADGKLTGVCTDGYRLAVNGISVGEIPQSKNFMIPARMATELCYALSHTKEKNVRFGTSDKLVQANISFGDTSLFVRLVEGEFPQYQSLIPQSFQTEVNIGREEWMSALKTSMVFAKETSSIVTLMIDEKNCTIRSASSGVGENEIVIESQKTGKEQTVSVNARFLMDVLSHVKSETVVLKINDPLKPVVFIDEQQPEMTAIVMPFKK